MLAHLGIDVGKTNLRVAVFADDLLLVQRWSVSTIDVGIARTALTQHLLNLRDEFDIQSTGISIFGPLQVDPNKQDYGAVIESSEPAWSDVNIPRQVASTLGKTVHFDFDVNAGAVAEATLGAGRDKASFVYVSVGTGIGGAYVHGTHRPGFAPQFGHTSIPREPDDLNFSGSCRFHGPCLQGLASGKAIEERWGKPAQELPPNHPAWDLEARYLARACTNLIYTFSPKAIVLGSSVGSVPHLIPHVNEYLRGMLNNFLEPELRDLYKMLPPVTAATLGADSSLKGAALLGIQGAGLPLG